MSASIPPCEGGTQRKDAIETRLSTQPPKETTSLNDVSHQTPDDNQHQALPTTKIVESDNQQVISPSPTIVRQSSEVPEQQGLSMAQDHTFEQQGPQPPQQQTEHLHRSTQTATQSMPPLALQLVHLDNQPPQHQQMYPSMSTTHQLQQPMQSVKQEFSTRYDSLTTLTSLITRSSSDRLSSSQSSASGSTHMCTQNSPTPFERSQGTSWSYSKQPYGSSAVVHQFTKEQELFLANILAYPEIEVLLNGPSTGRNVQRIRKADVHDKIAEALSKQFNTNLSGLQIKNKIANMRTTFSKAIKLKNMTGNGDKLGSTLRSRILDICHFYDIMEPIWSKSWSINPRDMEGSGDSTDNGNVFDTIGKDSADSKGEEKNKGAPEPAQQERVQVQKSLQQQEKEMRHSTSTKPSKRKAGVAELMDQLSEVTAGQTPAEIQQLKLELEHDEKLHKIEAEKEIELAGKKIELAKIKLEKKKQKAQDKLCEFLMSSQELHVKKKKQRMGRDDVTDPAGASGSTSPSVKPCPEE